MKKLMIVAALAAVATGCTSIEVSREGGYNDAQKKMFDHSNSPYHIDWKVQNERVKAEGVSECWFWIFASSDGCSYAAPGFTLDSGLAAAKDSATFHAVENAKSDALMGCMYRITKTSKWLGIYKETKAEVVGFPANVAGIELIKDRPIAIGKDEQIIRLPTYEKLEDRQPAPEKVSFFKF
jgi:hypothetical protein